MIKSEVALRGLLSDGTIPRSPQLYRLPCLRSLRKKCRDESLTSKLRKSSPKPGRIPVTGSTGEDSMDDRGRRG